MKSISAKVMLLSTSFLFRFEAAYALSSHEHFPAFDRHGTHTHYTQILAPVPHLSSARNEMEYKLASVCFVTDTTDCRGGNYDIPDYNICVEDGYDKTSCPDEFYIPENYCPYDSKYFANCRDACEGYVECVDPYYGVGEACRGLYEKCECDTCPGYVFESDIPRGYHKVGEACNSCDGPKYKYEINTCDGFMECTDTGPEDGAEVCWRGDTPTYSSCKPCAISAIWTAARHIISATMKTAPRNITRPAAKTAISGTRRPRPAHRSVIRTTAPANVPENIFATRTPKSATAKPVQPPTAQPTTKDASSRKLV